MSDSLLKGRFPIEIPESPGKIADLGSWGVWGGNFIVHIIERIAGKLRRIILLQFGRVTFRFHYGRDRKPLIFMI